MSQDGSSCKSYIKHPTEKSRLDNLAFASFPEDYLPYASSSPYHRKAPYLVWGEDEGQQSACHRKRRRLKACRRRCSTTALASFVTLVIFAILAVVAVSVYLGVATNLFRSPILSLSGRFRVTAGDEFVEELFNYTTLEFLTKAETYKALVEDVFLSSSLAPAFIAAKVYAFRPGSLIVFFRVHLDRRKSDLEDDETLLLVKSLFLEKAISPVAGELRNIALDVSSVDVREYEKEEWLMNTITKPKVLHVDRKDFNSNSNIRDARVETASTSHNSQSSSKLPSSSSSVLSVLVSHSEITTISTISNKHDSDASRTNVSRTVPIQTESTTSRSVNSSKGTTVQYSYGQWRPIALPGAIQVSQVSNQPLNIRHDLRGKPGKGSVHFLEDSSVSLKEITSSPRVDPLTSKPPKVSSIMSSVSLVILPSSKNSSVNEKKDEIPTIDGTPTKLLRHSDEREGREDKDSSLSIDMSNRNKKDSLRFIEKVEIVPDYAIDHRKPRTDFEKSNLNNQKTAFDEDSNSSSDISRDSEESHILEADVYSTVSPDILIIETVTGSFAEDPRKENSEFEDVYEEEEIILNAGEETSDRDNLHSKHENFQSKFTEDADTEKHYESVKPTQVHETSVSFNKDKQNIDSSKHYTELENSEFTVVSEQSFVENNFPSLNNSTINFFSSSTGTDIISENDSHEISEIVPGNPSTVAGQSTIILTSPTVFQNHLLRRNNFSFYPETQDIYYSQTPVNHSRNQNLKESVVSVPIIFQNGNQEADSPSDTTFPIRISEPTEAVTIKNEHTGGTSINYNDTLSLRNHTNASNNSSLHGLLRIPKVVPQNADVQFNHNDIQYSNGKTDNDNNDLIQDKFSSAMTPANNDISSSGEIDFSENITVEKLPTDSVLTISSFSVTPGTKDLEVISVSNTNTKQCSQEEFLCKSGECVSADTVCNMRRDCVDNSDEADCACSEYLAVIGQSQKICDGVSDCWDLSDEQNCPWCSPGQFICPQTRSCVNMSQVCDGKNDCPMGTDERHCVKLARDAAEAASSTDYHSEGYLVVRKKGMWGKLCLDSLDHENRHHQKKKLEELGQAVCSALTYSRLKDATQKKEDDVNSKNKIYYEISTQATQQKNRHTTAIFQQSECRGKDVVKVKCDSLECGLRPLAASTRRRIVGGQSSSRGSWPWQVALYKEGTFQCGAVLINSQWLVSAGHCFYSSRDAYWTARLGLLRRGAELPTPTERVRRVARIFMHPEYVDRGFINDIALLQLEEPVEFSDYLRPLCLPTEDEDGGQWHGQHCSVVGWGKLFEIGHNFPDSLQEVRLPVISTEECRKRIIFLSMYHITDNMFCAGYENGGKDACLGDSGGPLMCQRDNGRWILLGVTSNGDGCGRPGRPGVYTKVAKYLSWIQDMMNSNKNLPDDDWTDDACPGHRCHLGYCVKSSQLCDGRFDCADGSDEFQCSESHSNSTLLFG